MKRTAAVLSNGKHLVGIAANRELRSVPLWWRHPVDAAGEPSPLFSREHTYTEAEIQDYLAEGRMRAEIESWYMPDFASVPPQEMGVAVYETTSEGTPLTPVFPATRKGLLELLHYCTANCATFAEYQTDLDGWARLLGLTHVLEGREAS